MNSSIHVNGMYHRTTAIDEEELATGVPHALRRRHGVYFTPAPLVSRVLRAAARWVPRGAELSVIDPACGAGAFLAGAAATLGDARLLGVELDSDLALACRQRVPRAQVVVGDALASDALDALTGRLPPDGFQLWVGNPPYNGTSPLLKVPKAWARVCGWFPAEVRLPRGTSLREDYVFFLLRASVELERRPGALAFITSSTLLDAYLYGPVREALLRRLVLREVVDLGEGAFQGTKVRTCFSVWTSRWPGGSGPGGGTKVRRARQLPFAEFSGLAPVRSGVVRFSRGIDGVPQRFRPSGPDWRLRPGAATAERLDAQWRSAGELLTELVPVSLPGLKTRFDELLVDDDAERLLQRVSDFVACAPSALESFAAVHRIPDRLLPKLRALHPRASGVAVVRSSIRRFFRYRGPLAPGASAWCYLDRRLIPRGDHRLQGAWDPHLEAVKLVFNVHEVPLSARVYAESGCVTAYRHSRFAPLWVPEAALRGGIRRCSDTAALRLNLSPRGLNLADQLGSAHQVFEAIAAFVNSPEVQDLWAPEFGTSRILPIPTAMMARPGRHSGLTTVRPAEITGRE